MGHTFTITTSPLNIFLSLPRFQGLEESIERYVMEVVHEHLNRRQGPDNITRNFLKLLTSACGLVEVSFFKTISSFIHPFVLVFLYFSSFC